VLIASVALLGCAPGLLEEADAPDGHASEGAAEGGLDATVDVSDAGIGCLVCSDATEDLSPFTRVKDTVDQICSKSDGCHGSGAGQMGTSPTHEFGSMIGVASVEEPGMLRVLPGDPSHSYVFLKMACDGGIVGACMPFGSYDPVMAQAFHDWIEAGAPTQ
jgi:hypothetical protein